MKLKDYASLTATLRLKSGLHIGTGERPERGEPLPVMESPRTKLPYIPGSSLKVKCDVFWNSPMGGKKRIQEMKAPRVGAGDVRFASFLAAAARSRHMSLLV